MTISKWQHHWQRRLTALGFVLISATSGAAVLAQVLPKGVVKGPAVEGITEYRLSNGLKVLLFPDASKPTVNVNITYLVGSAHENYGETGMAHLLEHLMFKGAAQHKNIPQEFQKRGMSFNGTTTQDNTNYYEFFQAGNDNLKWAIELEADRMTHSFIARKDLDSEMTVVRNEFESGENSPFGVLQSRMQSIAYDWHNYGKTTIGNRSDIENVKIENLQAFYHTYYQPDNAVLLVTGKFDPAQALQWINTSFGRIPKPARKLPVAWTVEPTQDGERGFTIRRKGDVQIVTAGYKVPSGLHDDGDPLSFMAQILSDASNGRLHKQLVESGQAVQVFEYSLSGLAPGLQVFGAVIEKGKPVAPVRDALVAAVESFAKTPPTKEEMERVRRSYENLLESSLNDHQKIGSLLSSYIAMGDWRLLFRARDQLAKITPEQVTAVAAHYFKRDNRIVGNFLPEDQPQRAEIPPAPSVAEVMKDFHPKKDVSVAEAFDPSQANIDARTQRQVIGGLKLALLPKKNRGEMVSVAVRLHWGDEKSLFGQAAPSTLAGAMLTRGTSKYSREQLADEFDKLKIAGGLYDFETTRANLPAALRLVAHVLKEPSFPSAEFEQLRKQTLVSIETSRNDPQALASAAIAQQFNHYPALDIRAPKTVEQQLADVTAVTLAQVRAFHHDFYGASQGEIAIVGDFDAPAITKVVEETFGAWPSAKPYTRLSYSNSEVAPRHQMIDTPDKENGFYTARLNLDLRSDDADYPALMVANTIFGEGLSSRLMTRVRQKDGLSYGGGSSIDAGDIDRAGSFSIAAIAAPQNLIKLEAAIRQELERAVKDGFSAEEVAAARSGMMQQRIHNRSQDNILADGWSKFLYLGRTYAWSSAFEEKLRSLTAAQVSAAFRKAIDPAKLSVVVAGDAGKAKQAAAK
jgi:zinc protease